MSEEVVIPEPDVSEEHPVSDHWVWVGAHRPPSPRVLFDHMTSDWELATISRAVHPATEYSAARRQRLGSLFDGKTIIVPTGNYKTRANDTDYRFRAGTDFFYLTGCDEPDAVLLLAPSGQATKATLYVPRRRDATTHEFYTDARYGELWVGPRRGVDEAAIYYGIDTAPLEELEKDLVSVGGVDVVTLRGFDPSVDALHEPSDNDEELANALSELRLVKDDFEISQLQAAIDFTVKGFEDVVRALPSAEGRGELPPTRDYLLNQYVTSQDQPAPTVPASQSLPSQEPGTRPHRP